NRFIIMRWDVWQVDGRQCMVRDAWASQQTRLHAHAPSISALQPCSCLPSTDFPPFPSPPPHLPIISRLPCINFLQVESSALFDCHAKRIHEYKRQLLNILAVIHRYNSIKVIPCSTGIALLQQHQGDPVQHWNSTATTASR
ncbi:unnamed protein product, partial [Closterium sp. NIES-53]